MYIRRATPSDIDGIARVHVESWKTTYAGLISDTFLSTITLEGRIRSWRWTFNNLQQDEAIFVLENDAGDIVGFANGGKSRDSDVSQDGELYAIYLLKEVQGKGFGRRLFQTVVDHLAQRNYRTMKVWVLNGNPTERFYVRMGGQEVERKFIKIGEEVLEEIALSVTIQPSVES